MKWNYCFTLATFLLAHAAFALEPTILSGPVPAIESVYVAEVPSTIVYTISNNVPKNLPVTVTGLSDGLTRTTVANDCGDQMPAGPSTCSIGILINPTTAQIGSSINQVLEIDYQGRTTLKSPIEFSVAAARFAYVIPKPASNEIFQFLLNPVTGLFPSTFNTTYSNPAQNFGALVFATVNGTQYGYSIDQNGYAYQCLIDTDGTFSTCNSTPANPPSWAPRSIAFAELNSTQYAYVTDVNMGRIYQCAVQSDGSFGNASCPFATNSTFPAPYGISFASTNGSQYAYIADAGDPGTSSPASVYQCSMNPDGTFNACTTMLSGSAPNWIPYMVSFATSNGTQYAYVSDNGSTGTGNVYQCNLDPTTGAFTSCAITPAVDAPTINWYPYDITFATLEGIQYAYVANASGPTAGGMYVCTVSALNGSFSNCTSTPSTPPSPWQPAGVAFR